MTACVVRWGPVYDSKSSPPPLQTTLCNPSPSCLTSRQWCRPLTRNLHTPNRDLKKYTTTIAGGSVSVFLTVYISGSLIVYSICQCYRTNTMAFSVRTLRYLFYWTLKSGRSGSVLTEKAGGHWFLPWGG